MKLYRNTKPVHVTEMKDGDIALITEWKDDNSVVGSIVQMFGNTLLTLGERSINSWPTAKDIKKDTRCLVEILPKGTLIEI